MPSTRRNRWAEWYETCRRPWVVFVLFITLLYGRTITWGFVIDDHRLLAHCKQYAAGERASLDLYRFLMSDGQIQRLRAEGYYPWWLADGVRYKHFRPLAETILYGEYRVFGEWGGGYRVVSLALYLLSALLVLRIFRDVGGDERAARWGALAYVVATAHAVPVVFVAQQCDLIGLVPSLAAVASGVKYLRSGRGVYLVLAAGLFAISLGAKESSLGVCLLPAAMAIARLNEPRIRARALGLSGVLSGLGLAWLWIYVRGGNGANTSMMLDPIHAPADYFAALPVRIVAMLSSWIVPINPFIFYLHGTFRPFLIGYCVVGAVALILVGHMLWRWRRERPGVAGMALWPVPFLPLLACSPPDDRNMLLPGVGLAFLAGAWMTARRGDSGGLRRLPLVLFIVVNVVLALGVTAVLREMELGAAAALETAEASFGRPVRKGDCAFFLNNSEDSRILFSQYAVERMRKSRDLRVSHLCDIARPEVTRLDSYTIRIEGKSEALIDGFFGRMGRTRERPPREGDEFDAGEYIARITRMEGDQVRAVEVRFRRSLDDDGYRFLWSELSGVKATAVSAGSGKIGG